MVTSLWGGERTHLQLLAEYHAHAHDDEILKTYTKMDIWMEGHTRSVLSDLTGLNLHLMFIAASSATRYLNTYVTEITSMTPHT